MLLVKSRWQVEWYEAFLRNVRPKLVMEVGTFDGASLAFCAELVRPRRLVGVDIRAEPSAALATFLDRRQLHDRVHPYYGVDQTDPGRLGAIVRDEFAGESLDLVVDDASHALDASRATFDILFPYVKPGGLYVLEDWPTHRLPTIVRPLASLVFELILAASEAPDAIARVEVNRNYAIVHRGPAALESGAFALARTYGPRERALFNDGGQAPIA
jgi:cephalosporin hydroxylase